MIIYKTEIICTQYYEEINIFHNTWENIKTNTAQFKEAVTNVATLTEKYKPKGIIVDTRNFQFIITPDVQDWYNLNIATRHLKAGVKYMAFIVNKDFITQLSIEQTMDEEVTKKQKVKYFANLEEAKKWIISK